MSKQIKGLLYFYYSDLQFSFFIFWSILLVMLTIAVSMMYILPIELMTFSLTGPIYVYCSIVAFLMARQNVAAGIKLSATRKSIFVSTGIFFTAMALGFSVIASVLSTIVDKFLIKESMTFFFIHPMFFAEDTFLNRVYTDFIIILFIVAISYMISLLFYKFGLLISGLIVGISFVGFTYSIISTNLILNIIEGFQTSMYMFFGQLGVIGIAVYGCSWLLLRRITVVAQK